ncbi:hypothetical protein IEO21_10910 [Rhodonia placenta]|uniref:Survival protein SurE-like phosphatase/nucleotidase domain-containing protein n=1 Tax=Rhodonia placenta TaxID=104341 RepID=A0A8H7TX28_9APHY|nr:hypothetical protein IEO21_10910 [Postia placenta]
MLSSAWLRLALAFASISALSAQNILLTNDDGWAVAQIRAQYDALTGAEFNVVLLCPAQNQSGNGSDTTAPTMLTEPCEFNTCPTGSPPEGYNSSNPRINYVNAYPVDAVHYGIKTLSPEFFNKNSDFVVSGPNIGSISDEPITFHGGAACEAAKLGVPSTAFSSHTGAQVPYTILESDPNAKYSESSRIYSALTVNYTKTILKPGVPPLPKGIIVNINYHRIDMCRAPSDYKWVFSLIGAKPLWAPIHPFSTVASRPALRLNHPTRRFRLRRSSTPSTVRDAYSKLGTVVPMPRA